MIQSKNIPFFSLWFMCVLAISLLALPAATIPAEQWVQLGGILCTRYQATFSTAASLSVQSPTSRHYRCVSAPKSEVSVCAKGTFKLVSTKLAWGPIAIQLQQYRTCAGNNILLLVKHLTAVSEWGEDSVSAAFWVNEWIVPLNGPKEITNQEMNINMQWVFFLNI